MAFNVSEMRSQLTGGGARPTLFSVQITNPIDGVADFKVPFMVKASSLPASTVGSIPVPYFGRKINFAGDRTFEEWTVEVINDEDFAVRNSMETWMNAINSHQGNLRAQGSPESYKTQGQITQFGKAGEVLRVYNFNGLFPTNISAITTSWESNDTIEEFTATFQFDWWDVAGGITGRSTT